MHANHAIRDVKQGRLRGGKPREFKDLNRTDYLGVKGSQVQILSARPLSPGEPRKHADLRGFFYARDQAGRSCQSTLSPHETLWLYPGTGGGFGNGTQIGNGWGAYGIIS